jgi:hypothetical protein
MDTINKHENFPGWIVILSNLGSFIIYTLGFMIMYKLGLIISLLYLLYVFILEYRIIRYHCVDCYYWGKTCGFGKGRISSILFKKGDISRFCIKDMTFKNLIPDLLVSLIPIVAGIVFLILKFDFILLFAVLLLILLTTFEIGRAHV